jgi:hypothetical protein
VRALRIAGQATVHSTSRHVDFHFYAHTACNLRVNWKATLHETVTLDPSDDDRLVIAEPVDEPVDCMTCLVRLAREEDKADKLTNTNPSAEIKL